MEHFEGEGVRDGLWDAEGDLVKEVDIDKVTEMVCDREFVTDVEPVLHTVTLNEGEGDTEGLVLCDTVRVTVMLGVGDVVVVSVVEGEVVPQVVALNEVVRVTLEQAVMVEVAVIKDAVREVVTVSVGVIEADAEEQ